VSGTYVKRSDPTEPREHAEDAYRHYRERFQRIFEETGENLTKVTDRLAEWLKR